MVTALVLHQVFIYRYSEYGTLKIQREHQRDGNKLRFLTLELQKEASK